MSLRAVVENWNIAAELIFNFLRALKQLLGKLAKGRAGRTRAAAGLCRGVRAVPGSAGTGCEQHRYSWPRSPNETRLARFSGLSLILFLRTRALSSARSLRPLQRNSEAAPRDGTPQPEETPAPGLRSASRCSRADLLAPQGSSAHSPVRA